jgi:hypothetical protein
MGKRVGQALDEGDALMRSAPPRMIETILRLLIPPACREEVLGDLYESCDSLGQYVREALRVAPMVLFRIRRTADSQVLLMQAVALYLSFLGAACQEGKAFLLQDSVLLRLAIPPIWVVFGLILDDAYAVPGKRSFMKQMRGPVLGLAFAYLSQVALSADNLIPALPLKVMFFGSAAGGLFSIGLRYLFPSVIDRPAGAGGPALWLKHAPEPFRFTREVAPVAKILAFVLVLAFIGGQLGGQLLAAGLIFASILFVVVRELRRRWR